jgi:hypothetical protein
MGAGAEVLLSSDRGSDAALSIPFHWRFASLVAPRPSGDLLLFAKHLFVSAIRMAHGEIEPSRDRQHCVLAGRLPTHRVTPPKRATAAPPGPAAPIPWRSPLADTPSDCVVRRASLSKKGAGGRVKTWCDALGRGAPVMHVCNVFTI